jgi:lipopolysaccharide export system ATP-binding protein
MTANAESGSRGVGKRLSRVALQVQDLAASWGSNNVLSGLDLCLDPGEKVAILGPNGAGKSTLFDAVTGRLRPLRGQVCLAGQDLSGKALHERALLGLGYVPQEPCVFATLSVRENLVAALRSPVAARWGPPTAQETAVAVDAILAQWSLTEAAHRPAAVLSGGERRRLEVSRALLLRPRVLLLDEPFTGLDPAARALLRAGLMRLAPSMTLLVSDHSAEDVLAVCPRVVVLVDGKIVFDGPSGDFQPGVAGYRRYFGS